MARANSFKELKQLMQERGLQVRVAMEAALKEHTSRVYSRCKELLNSEIYSIPEDIAQYSIGTGRRVRRTIKVRTKAGTLKVKGGKKKWRRTGNLRNSERMRIYGLIAEIRNDAAYALPRHDLGLPAGHPDAIEGSKRKSWRIAPWRKRAVREEEPNRLPRFREAVLDVLRK